MVETAALVLLILFPFFGAAFAALMKNVAVARAWALLVSFMVFALAVVVAVSGSPGHPVQFGIDEGSIGWLQIREIGFAVRLSCDGISTWLVLLTALIAPLVILSVGKEIDSQPNARGYYAWILVLVGAMLGSFLAADALLFYFFFELTLIPSIMLIGIWGGPERREAAGKFFIYTFAGSIFLLISILYLASKTTGMEGGFTFEISKLIEAAQSVDMTSRELFWIGAGLLVGFLIKTPVFPLHTWQPLAYSQAPAGTTVLMAAIMSKLGTYGLIRFTLPMAFSGPFGNPTLQHLVIVLCLIGIVYGGLIAWVQKDMVRLMAYSSLSHLGLCVLAIFATSTLSLQGAVMYMIAHGLSTAALLMIIGMIASRTGTRNIDEMSGLFAKMPVLSVLLVLFTMASVGLPITSGFVGEFLSLQGVMNKLGLEITLVAATGMVLGAIYMLHMVAKVGFGPLKAPEGAELKDLCPRELISLLPLAVAVIALGVSPTPVLDSFKEDAKGLAKAWKPKDIPTVSEEAFFRTK